MNENQLTIVKEYKVDMPDIHRMDSIIDKCLRDCHKKYYPTFEYECEYVIKLSNIRKNEIKNLKNADESMDLYEINKKLKHAP